MAKVTPQNKAMLAAWRALEARGSAVKAVKIGPDGSVLLMTESPTAELPSAVEDWVSLAGLPTQSSPRG